MRKSQMTDSKYPEDDRDLEVYSGWEAGPQHFDFKNKTSFDNRSDTFNINSNIFNNIFYLIAGIF